MFPQRHLNPHKKCTSCAWHSKTSSSVSSGVILTLISLDAPHTYQWKFQANLYRSAFLKRGKKIYISGLRKANFKIRIVSYDQQALFCCTQSLIFLNISPWVCKIPCMYFRKAASTSGGKRNSCSPRTIFTLIINRKDKIF